MYRLILILLFLSFSALSDAEKLDEVLYRIVYNAETRKAENGKIAAETAYLDIGNEVTYFYNYDLFRYQFVRDSLRGKGYNDKQISDYNVDNKVQLPSMRFSVLRNYPSVGKTLYSHFIPNDYYYYEEETPQIDWQLIAGDTTLLGYQCQKATCKFRGREWTVYYTMDIPISEGPYKFCGLPGLVMYAADSKGDFTFSCIGIESPNVAEIVVDKSKWQKVEKKKLNKMLIEYFDDHIAWALRGIGAESLLAKARETDARLRKKSLVPCLIETFE